LSTYKLIQRARAEAKKEGWLLRLKPNILSPTPNVLVAPIAAGEKVVTSKRSSLLRFLQTNYGDAIAVEMEGRGLLQASHANQQVSALIVRGISDLINSNSKTDKTDWQEIAARHASAFAFEILAKL
jgi:nucleoside phosphorylase